MRARSIVGLIPLLAVTVLYPETWRQLPEFNLRAAESAARASFETRFWIDGRCLDVVDGATGDSRQVRPNCLLACSLPSAPLKAPGLLETVGPSLLTSIGLRSRSPDDPSYLGRHRDGPAERDRAYHQGTVWPWLAGPYVQAAITCDVDAAGVLDGLSSHISRVGTRLGLGDGGR